MENLRTISDVNINISDVLDAIQTTDPTFGDQTKPNRSPMEMISVSNATTSGNRESRPLLPGQTLPTPYIEILEQPASKALRFRYECEGRSAGSIPGERSTQDNKTFPSIRINGYKGRAIVVVSCVTKDMPHRSHPHNLVGKESCKRGICTVEVSPENNMTVTFDKLGIQCVKRKDIEEALKIREELRVDPFRTGFDHKRQPTSIDLNCVRLCFQVFLEGDTGRFKYPLKPVVSQPIYDKKAMTELQICEISHCSGSTKGDEKIVLLCDKVAKEDIQVRFYEKKDGETIWEDFGKFDPNHVHKQVAITFRTPAYKIQDIIEPVEVFIQLRRQSDGATSAPHPFLYKPAGTEDPNFLRRKRLKYNDDPSAYILRHVQNEASRQFAQLNPQFTPYNINNVKVEPTDKLSPFVDVMAEAGPSSSMYNVGNTNLRPVLKAARRTPSPRVMYNIPPTQPQQQPQQLQQTQNFSCQLQPIITQNSPSPVFIQDSPAADQMDNNYQMPFTTGIGNAIGNAMNISNVDDTQQAAQLIDYNLSQLDNVDFSSLNISDIVNEEADAVGMGNREQQVANHGTDILDSYTKMCLLNNFYKSSDNQ